ncbi:phospholipid:diacylglycerol acyltransferase [Savitreella phatthalungensis]
MLRRTRAGAAADHADPAPDHSPDEQDDTQLKEKPKTLQAKRPDPITRLSRSASVQRLKKVTNKKWSKKWVFLLGGLLGAGIAMWYGAAQINFADGAMAEFFDDLSAHMPASVVMEAQKISQRRQEAATADSFAVGRKLKKEGYHLDLATVMIPGVISTGLESWITDGPAAPYYRKRLWGSWNMIRAMLTDKPYWMRAISLDPVTGLDPECCKLRAAASFDASDFFITGYWIWNKILENLSAIGGEPGNMFTASYDWRLSFSNLEHRDGYFSKLKMHIETAVKLSGKKTVLVSHSMGSQVIFYFFKWVEAEGDQFGSGGSTWVDDHIDSWINISGSMLGAPKTVAALLSGEMKDTAQLNALAVYGLEAFFSKKERAAILRTMPGISSMLPKGGDRVWGTTKSAPDDRDDQNGTTFGQFIRFKDDADAPPQEALAREDASLPRRDNMTMSGAFDYLLEHTTPDFHRMLSLNYSHGVALTQREVERNDRDPSKWINPLEVSLPYAPNLKIYCFYGVGKPTERTYFYEQSSVDGPASLRRDMLEDDVTRADNLTRNKTITPPLHIPFPRAVQIDPTVSTAADGTDKGVRMGEGDGTVSLLSSGYMCARGWRGVTRYNPAGAPVKVVEMAHEEDTFDIRGGPKTADHVDILGRPELSLLIGKVVAGNGHEVTENWVSDIRKYADRVDIPI